MPDYCIGIIDKLIERRKSSGMTQKDLAAKTNLTQSVIARFESKKNTPQLDTLLKIVAALDCTLVIEPNKNSSADNTVAKA